MNISHDKALIKVFKVLVVVGTGYTLFRPLLILSVAFHSPADNVVKPFYIIFALLLGAIGLFLIKDDWKGKILYSLLIVVLWLSIHATDYSFLFG